MKTYIVKIRGGSTAKIEATSLKDVMEKLIKNWKQEEVLNVVKIEEERVK